MPKQIDTSKAFRLPVKHFTQLDNTGGQGARECFLTSSAMLADYLLEGELTRRAKAAGYKEPEDAYAVILDDFGDTTNWSAQRRALASIGIVGYKSTTASIKDVELALRKGTPVIIGTKYKASGHILLLIGIDAQGRFIGLCPNGIRRGATNQWVTRFLNESQAKDDTFSRNLLKQIFTDLGDEAGWAFFVTHVDGEPTGVPAGL